MARISETRLKSKYEHEDTKTLCMYYDTVLKIRESCVKYRQVNPYAQSYKDMYDELYYVEDVIRKLLFERFVETY